MSLKLGFWLIILWVPNTVAAKGNAIYSGILGTWPRTAPPKKNISCHANTEKVNGEHNGDVSHAENQGANVPCGESKGHAYSGAVEELKTKLVEKNNSSDTGKEMTSNFVLLAAVNRFSVLDSLEDEKIDTEVVLSTPSNLINATRDCACSANEKLSELRKVKTWLRTKHRNERNKEHIVVLQICLARRLGFWQNVS